MRSKTKPVISPIAFEAVQKIDAIFALERSINGLSPQERLAARSQDIAPLVNDLLDWMRQERAKLPRHNDVAKAMDYMLRRIDAFTRFLNDGRICLTNNAAERALRGIALGRTSWLFAGSDEGASYCPSDNLLINRADFAADREMTGSNSHFGGECDFKEGCDRLNRGAFRRCAGRGESDSSSVWERSRILYRGYGGRVRVCRTSGAGKTSITSWLISAWRRLHRFSCRARRFWPISGTWRTGTAMVARTARRCLG